jgi:Putative glycolipid-binding
MRTRSYLLGLMVTLAIAAPGLLAGTASANDDTPVSSGQFEIRLGGKRIGEEQFRVFRHKGYRVESTRMLYWPEPARTELTYELEESLEPRKLSMVVTRGGIVTELQLAKKGDNWRAEVKGQGRDKKKQELGRRAGSVVDFDSLLFNSLAIAKLLVPEGSSKEVDAITLALPDVAGARAREVYRRVEDEEIETKALGKVTAAVYEIEAGSATHRLWVAPSGIVVRSVFTGISGEQETILVRMKASPGSWLR